MALLLTGTASQFLNQPISLGTGDPFTFSAWVNFNLIAPATLISISSYAIGFTDMLELCVDASSVSAQVGTGTTFGRGGPHSSLTLITNTWYHCCAVFPVSGTAIVYVNGDSKATSTGLGTPVGSHFNQVTIGVLQLSNVRVNPINGMIAFPAIWNVALTDADVANLAGGIDPTTIHSANLLSYNLLGATLTHDEILVTPWVSNGTLVQTTDPALGIPIVSAQTCTNIATTSVTLNGTLISIGTASTTTEGFNYGLDRSYGSTVSTDGTFSPGTYTSNITGLLPDTVYHFQAFAINSNGTGVSPDLTVLTASVAGTVHTISPFIDPHFMTGVPWLDHSYWIQGNRGWFDTVPSTNFINGIGVHFNGPSADLIIEQLARNNVKNARVEFVWGGLSYTDDSVTPASQPGWQSIIVACQKWGVRPLVLLNANVGLPCPLINFNKTVAVLAGLTSTSLTLTDTTGLVPGYSGFNRLTTDRVCEVFITSVNTSTNVCQLSNKLPIQFLANRVCAMSTLKYKPWSLPGSVDYNNTMAGWKKYVLNMANFMANVVGPGGWDFEIWNELTFDSQFLDINNYYFNKFPVPASTVNASENRTWTDIIQATCDVAIANPTLFNGVKMTDGFADTIPWPGAAQEPHQISAISKHPYPPFKVFPAADQKLPAVNALFGVENLSVFVPTFNNYFPDYGLTHFQTEIQLRDVAPITMPINAVNHGRLARNETTTTVNTKTVPGETTTTTVVISKSNPCPLWLTETAYNPTVLKITDVPTALLIKGKMQARLICGYLGKGAERVYLFSADGTDINFGVCQDNFITYCTTNTVYPDPSVEASYTSHTLRIIKNMVNAMAVEVDTSISYANSRKLNILSVSDTHNNVIFFGDGTLEHPNLYHRDMFMMSAFQVNSSRFVLPYYVMTIDTGATYPLAPENFDVTLSGFHHDASTFSVYDPVLESTSLLAATGSGTTSTVTLSATDYPIFLIVNDPISDPLPGTLPTVSTVSATVITTSSATLSGQIVDVGGSSSSIQGFHYGLTSSYGTTVSDSGQFGPGTFTQDITGLIPATTYHYVAFSVNATGEGKGVDGTFSTNGITAEGFFLGPTTDYGQTLTNVDHFVEGPFQYTVNNLQRGQTYHFKAFGQNAIGLGRGLDSTFIISANTPTVQTVGAIVTDFINVTLQGNLIDFGGNAQSITAGFNWGVSTSYDHVSTVGVSALGQFQVILLNLARGHTYHFQAFGTNEFGTGNGLDLSVFLAPPPSVQTLPAMFVTSTTATLFANISSFESLVPTAIGFYWGATTGYGFSALVPPPFVPGIFQATLTGLIPGALYHAQAFVTTDIGDGLGGDITFTTIQLPPEDTLWQPLETFIERVVGVNEPTLDTDIKLEALGVEPTFLHHGGRTGDWIPDDMLHLYKQMYHQAGSIPRVTGESRSDVLSFGGSLPYDGKT